MRKFVLVFSTFMLALGSTAQQTGNTVQDGHNHSTTPGTTTATTISDDVLILKETEHDFLTIQQGRPVYYSFEIVNTGKAEQTNAIFLINAYFKTPKLDKRWQIT